MSAFESILSEPAVTALGWALVHFLWQGALIAGVLGMTLAILRDGGAGTRYLACCIAMGLMMIAPLVTFVTILRLQGEAIPAAGAVALLDDVTASSFWQRLSGALPELTLLWLIGVGAFQARMILSWTNAQRMKLRGIRPAPAVWQQAVNALSDHLGIRRTVCLLESSLATVPMMIGWLRPVILVPTGAFTGLSPQQLRAVLAHELAHIRRLDYVVNLVQAVFESVLFYHPAVWWLSNRLRVEREYCCDDIAVRVAGDALDYAQALSCLDELRDAVYQPALASTGGILMNRIRRLVGLRALPAPRIGAWVSPLVVTAAVLSVTSVLTSARPAEEQHFVHETIPEFVVLEPIAELDLVSVLERIDSEQAEFFAVLRDAGLDNETMLMILERLDPDPRVMRSIAHAASGKAFNKLHEIHERLAQAVEEGGLTKEEATKKFERVKLELHERAMAETGVRRMRTPEAVFFSKEIHALRESIEDDLAAGLITEQEAEDRLDELHDEIAAKMDRHRRETIEHVHARLDAAREKIESALEAGLITEEEAKAKMRAVKEEIHKGLIKRFGPRRVALGIVQEKMHALHAELEEQLDAGLITEKEAQQRLTEASIALHEHLDMNRQLHRVKERKRRHADGDRQGYFGHDSDAGHEHD